MAVIVVGLLYLATLAAVLAFVAGGWAIAVTILAVVAYVLFRALPSSHVADDDGAAGAPG